MDEEAFWAQLVDEPIADLVARVRAEDEEIAGLVSSPHHELAFRTFACVRVGLLLGELLVEHDVVAERSERWVESLLADPELYDAVTDEIRAVAREVAADPKLATGEAGADAEMRERFRDFARRSLGE